MAYLAQNIALKVVGMAGTLHVLIRSLSWRDATQGHKGWHQVSQLTTLFQQSYLRANRTQVPPL